jgi:hypothetical protein
MEPDISNFDSSDQSSTGLMPIARFLAQASLFLLLLSFGSGFFAAI